MNRYFQPEIECADPAEIKKLQSEKLVKQIQHVWNNVPYYRKKMEAKGVTPDDIHGVEDLHKLPFLSKADLREAYPYGLMGKPLNCNRCTNFGICFILLKATKQNLATVT